MSNRQSGSAHQAVASSSVDMWTLLCHGTLWAFALFLLVLLLTDLLYVDAKSLRALVAPHILGALWLSLWTSVLSTVIAMAVAVPGGYALSRLRVPGRGLVDALVDVPIVFPPLAAGLTLLLFFARTAPGRFIEHMGLEFVFQPRGIVLCQFFASASFAVRAAKGAFDEVDARMEQVALTLGCTGSRCFRRVTLPLAWNGVLAGAIQAWAKAFGLFGPLVVFVGTFRGRTEVLSTTAYLEQSVGNLEASVAATLLLVAFAFGATLLARRLGGRGRKRP